MTNVCQIDLIFSTLCSLPNSVLCSLRIVFLWSFNTRNLFPRALSIWLLVFMYIIFVIMFYLTVWCTIKAYECICENCQACVRISFPLPGGWNTRGTTERSISLSEIKPYTYRQSYWISKYIYLCNITICN